MKKWHKYAVGELPEDVVVDGEVIPVPVVIRFEDGHEAEDWIVGGTLFLYCEKSCAWLLGHVTEWRYLYDSKEQFLEALSEHRAECRDGRKEVF